MAYKEAADALTQLLSNMALQAQQGRQQEKLRKLDIEQEERARTLNIKANEKAYLQQRLDTKMDELNSLAMANDESQVAFQNLNPKYKTSDAEGVVSEMNQLSLEGLNSQISDLRSQITQVDQSKLKLGQVITDIGEAKNLLQQQAIIRGAGEDNVFTSEDLAGLQTELPRDSETGEYVTATDFAKAIETGENIEMYDFDASGTLNQKDYELFQNIKDLTDKKVAIETDERADAEELYKSTIERVKSSETLEALNMQLITGEKFASIDRAMVKDQLDQSETELASSYSNLFFTIFSQEEEDGPIGINPVVEEKISQILENPDSEFYIKKRGARNRQKEVIKNAVLQLRGAGTMSEWNQTMEAFRLSDRESYDYLQKLFKEEIFETASQFNVLEGQQVKIGNLKGIYSRLGGFVYGDLDEGFESQAYQVIDSTTPELDSETGDFIQDWFK